jgi:hypothetical protein
MTNPQQTTREVLEMNCCAQVHESRYGMRPCCIPASVERDGRYYCGTHDPVRLANRKAKPIIAALAHHTPSTTGEAEHVGATPPQVEPAPNPWKDAVLDQLASHAMDAPTDMPPADILKRVIDMAVTMATDPAISEPAPRTAGERMEILSGMAREQLNGQTLVYDTESGQMKSVPKPATTKEARWVRISEYGEGQENYCEECGAEPGSSCTDVEGREWGRRVHAIRQGEPAALLVGELTTCQMCGDKPYPGCNSEFQGDKACRFYQQDTLTDEQIDEVHRSMWGKSDSTLNDFARAILAAASSQPVREPLTPDTHYQEWKHGCESMCTNITLWLDRCPHCGKPRPVVEAAHGITKKGAP